MVKPSLMTKADAFGKFLTNIKSSSTEDLTDCSKFVSKSFDMIKDDKDKHIFNHFKYLKTTKHNINNSFSFRPVSLEIVEHFFAALNSKSGAGVSEIPMKVLTKIFDFIKQPITNIFNACVNSNVFPDEWKCAIVTPLYKNKGDRTDLNNYRCISVLAPIAKLFEKCIAAQIFDYFETNKLFFIGQHGFRKNFSCETAMHEIISEINSNLDKRLITMLLLIDFKKSF